MGERRSEGRLRAAETRTVFLGHGEHFPVTGSSLPPYSALEMLSSLLMPKKENEESLIKERRRQSHWTESC